MKAFRFAVPLAWLVLTAPTWAGSLNDTGQVDCFNASTTPSGTVSILTPDPEDAGFVGQDCSRGASAADAVGVQVKIGGSSVLGRDYTKIANDGSELPESAMQGPNPGDWGCTRDNITGLTWELRPNNGSFRDRDHRFSWQNNINDEGDTCGGTLSPTCNTDAYLAAVASSGGLCGANDWQLPSPQQLEGLLAYADPADSKNLIDRSWFPDQAFDEINPFVFWSNQPADTGTTSAWVADFDFGGTNVNALTAPAFVRLVRSSTPVAGTRFSLSEPATVGEAVITDAHTGLIWKQCPQGLSGPECTGTLETLDWSAALTAADNESFAGVTDWRLPNIIELASIRDYTPVDFPIIPLDPLFKGTTATDTYWSSTNDPRPTSLETALAYQFADSASSNTLFKTQSLAVRLVRGGHFLADHGPGLDTTPDSFSFIDAAAPAGELVESASAVITGLTGPASLRVTGAAESAYSINLGDYSTLAGAVRNGDSIRMRHRAAASIGATASTTLTIGGVSASFTSTAGDNRTAQTITFGDNPGPLEVFAINRAVSATASSTLPVSYGTTTAGICSVHANTGDLTLLAVGDCIVTADQAGNSEFGPAPQQTQTVVVTLASQVIVIDAPLQAALSQSPLTISVSGGRSGNPVSTASSTPAICSVSGSSTVQLALLATGTCTLTAEQTGDARYAAGQASAQIEVIPTPPSPPAAPSNLVVVPRTESVTLQFDAPADDGGSPITAYLWSARPASGDTLFGTCELEACEVAAGLVAGQSYVFGIAAVNAAGSGPRIEAAPTVIPTASLAFPNAPTGLRLIETSFDSLTVGWDPLTAPTNQTIAYRVEVAEAEGGPYAVAGVTADVFIDVIDLEPETQYFVRVTGIDSNSLAGTPSAPVSGVTDEELIDGSALPVIDFVDITRTTFPEGYRGDPGYRIEVLTATESLRVVRYQERYKRTSGGRSAKRRKANLTPSGFDGSRYLFDGPALKSPENYSGPALLKLRVRQRDAGDRLRYSSRARLFLEFTAVNDPPLMTASGTTRTDAPMGKKSVSTVQIAGFISETHAGAADEQDEEAQLITTFFVHPDPDNLDPSPVSNVSIDAAGTLQFSVDGSSPNAEGYRYGFYLMARDDGDDHYGDGLCLPNRLYGRYEQRACSPPQKFSIVVGEHSGVNVSAFRDTRPELEAEMAAAAKIAIDDSDIPIVEDFELGEPDPLTYRMEVSNLGAVPVAGAGLVTTSIAGLREVSWTCSTPVGVCTPASGSGAVDTRFDLGADNFSERAEITLTGKPIDGQPWVQIAARAAMPDGTGDTPFDIATILDSVSPDGIFIGGFE